MRVEELMTQPAQAVGPRTTLREAAEVMAGRRISGLPVVDAEDRVVGVVSEADVLAVERGGPPRRSRRGRNAPEARDDAITVEAAMTAPPVTVTGATTVAEAAALMLQRDVERLPVVDDDGRLVGVITRADLVRGIASGHSLEP